MRTAADWADAHRILPQGNAVAGPWRTDLVPYTRAICDAIASPDYREVILVMGAQMGKTETLLNVVGHRMHDGPRVPTLIVQPSENMAREFSRDRFTKMIDSTPELRAIMATGHADKVTEKWFAGVPVRFAWAGSPAQLASRASGLVLVDEVDRMAGDVGGEGDPLQVIRARADSFPDATIVTASTPTTDLSSVIWREFRNGTMDVWAWPCDGCGALFVPRLGTLRWPKGADPEEAAARAVVVCPNCEHEHADDRRRPLNSAGSFFPHRLDDEGELEPAPARRESVVASYWVPGLASPFVSFGESARRMVAALRKGDIGEIQAVQNTRFGEIFREQGSRKTAEELERLRGTYARDTWPTAAAWMTGGIDVQKNGLYWIVRAWGHLSQSWLIAEGFLHGRTDYDDVWIALDRVVSASYGGRSVRRWMIDTGYRPGDVHDTNRLERFVLDHGRVSGYKGRAQLSDDRVIQTSALMRSTPAGRVKTGESLYVADTDKLKTWIRDRLARDPQDPGSFVFHREAPASYVRALASEELIVRATGKRVWRVLPGYENHYLDCEVMARAAAIVENVDQIQPPEQRADAPAAKRRQRAASSDWLDGYS